MSEDTLIGKHLANYQVERLLGANGIGRLYSGTNVILQQPVTICILDPRYRHNQLYSQRFIRDSRTVATWSHANIVKVQSIGTYDQVDYVVSAAVEGLDLAATLEQHSAAGWRLPQATILHIGRSLAGALDFAHSRGIVHRDLKPANIILAADQRVLLANFGLATDLQAALLSGAVGPTHYIAPEQARRSADAVGQSDIYALGVLLHELLTGAGKSAGAQPKAVLAVLNKARSSAPADRYPTATALLNALEAARPLAAVRLWPTLAPA